MIRGTPWVTGWSGRLLALSLAGFAAAAVFVFLGPVESAQAQCGDPAGPTCPPPKREPTETNTRRPPTWTPTATLTATFTPSVTPTPTHTITPVPTHTPFPTPIPQSPPPPLVDLITTIIGKFAPDPELTAPIPPWMQPPNLELTAVEITQVIQCMHNLQCADNSVPLFSGKLTMVRAYVRIKGGPMSFMSNIGGALCYGNTGAAGCLNPIRPLYKINVWDWGNDDVVNKTRGQLMYTLDFILPSYMVSSAATQNLTVYANYNFEDQPQESYYKDNFRTIQYQVEASQPINVNVHLVHNNLVLANPGSAWDVYDFLDLTYPTSQVNLAVGVPLLLKDYAWTVDVKWGCTKGWKDLLADLMWLRGTSGPISYGLVPRKTLTGGADGCGYYGAPGSAGVDDVPGAGRVAAQEIGHNIDRGHAPGCGAGDQDTNAPGVNGGIDETGTDVLHRKLYEPYWAFDFMGYCGGAKNTWTSMYTYQAIAGRLPAGAYTPPTLHLAAPLRAGQIVLTASGEASPSQAIVEHGFYKMDGAGMALTADGGPYAVDLLDEAGDVLASHPFALQIGSNGEPGNSGPFFLTLPWVDGTTTAVFRYQDQEIGRVETTRRAPELTFVSPSESQPWTSSGPQTLSWTGSDRDGDPLEYLLQYSADGGQTWSVLAPNLTETSFEIDAAWLAGSEDARLRLLATDGFNTVSVDSVPLQIESKPPLVHISGPTVNDGLIAGSTAVLQGAATDLEDGFLGDDSLSWSSDVDGVLGTGRTTILPSLSEGPHTLTLTAIDSDGNASTASVDVVVGPAPVVEPSAPGPSPLWCLVGLIALGGATLAGAFFLGRRSRGVQSRMEV